jgi:hypothetical protein
MTQPAWRTGGVYQGISTAPTTTIPAAAVAGDYAVIGIASDAAPSVGPSSPSGSWASLGSVSGGAVSTPATIHIYAKALTSADTGGTHSVGWNFTGTHSQVGLLGVWSSCTAGNAYASTIPAGISTTVTTASNGVDSATFTGAGVLNVTSTSSFATSGTILTRSSSNIWVQISYTGVTATTFTGCTTLAGSGTFANGNPVGPATTQVTTPPTALTTWDNSMFVEFASQGYTTTTASTWNTPTGWTQRESGAFLSSYLVFNAVLEDQGSTGTGAYTTLPSTVFSNTTKALDTIGITVVLTGSPAELLGTGSTININTKFGGGNPAPQGGVNGSWPQLITEVAFSSKGNVALAANGQLSQAALVWTDISDRVLSLSGLTRGQSYELAQPTTGSGSMVLRNNDGAFDANNTGSPYYPNVLPMRPARVMALWNGTLYPVWSGYIRTWPQTWDTSRFGTSNAAVIDAIGTLQGGLLPVMAAAMQASDPVHLWPLSESLSPPVAGGPDVTWNWTDEGTSLLPLSLTYPASNPGFTGTANAPLPLWYAADHNLPADSSEGVRITGSTSQKGPSGTATDGISLFPLSGQIVTWELWGAVYDTGSSFAALLNITSGATQYLEVLIQAGTNPNLLISYNGGQVTTPGFTWLGQAANHIIITVDATYPTPIMVVWVDGFLINSYPLTGTTLPTSAVTGISLVGPYAASTSDAQVMCCAMYQRYLDSAEIAAHILAYPGYPGKTTGNRVGNIFDWANWNGPTSIDTGLSTMQNAVGLGGQTLAAALQQCVNTEFGTLFVDASGNLTFGDRSRLSNTTSVATLGDGTGEIPYLGTIDFGFDPTYVYDRVVVSRNKGSTTTVRTVSTAQQYFPNTLTKTVYSDTDTDASNQATYLASTYSIPRQRVSTITLDPLTAQTWASVLPLEIGNVVTVNARPQGGATISSKFRIQQIGWTWNPSSGVTVTMQISPLLPTPTW